MSYILLYHNANVKPVMIGKKRSIILHDVMLLKVRRTRCAMNPAGKKNSLGTVHPKTFCASEQNVLLISPSHTSRFFVGDKSVWFLGSSHTSRFFVADLLSPIFCRVNTSRMFDSGSKYHVMEITLFHWLQHVFITNKLSGTTAPHTSQQNLSGFLKIKHV